jgi:hypothetical protein
MATKSLPLFCSQFNALYDVVNRRTGERPYTGLPKSCAERIAKVLNSPAAFCTKSECDLVFHVEHMRGVQ